MPQPDATAALTRTFCWHETGGWLHPHTPAAPTRNQGVPETLTTRTPQKGQLTSSFRQLGYLVEGEIGHRQGPREHMDGERTSILRLTQRSVRGRKVSTIAALVEVILSDLAATDAKAPATLVEFGGVMVDFARFCERGHGLRSLDSVTPEVASEFVHSIRRDGKEVSVAWMHVRRGAIRMLFRKARELGLVFGDPTLDLQLPPRSSLTARALTDDEVELCRAYALDSRTALRRPLAWALSEATARTSEIHQVRLRDVDLGRGRVYLHGATTAEPRLALLTPWGVEQVERRLRAREMEQGSEARLIVWRSRNPRTPRASSSMAIIETLRAAGLAREPDVRPGSIVAWAGARLLREGATIDQVARSLGCRGLDQAAKLIGFDWRAGGSDR